MCKNNGSDRRRSIIESALDDRAFCRWFPIPPLRRRWRHLLRVTGGGASGAPPRGRGGKQCVLPVPIDADPKIETNCVKAIHRMSTM